MTNEDFVDQLALLAPFPKGAADIQSRELHTISDSDGQGGAAIHFIQQAWLQLPGAYGGATSVYARSGQCASISDGMSMCVSLLGCSSRYFCISIVLFHLGTSMLPFVWPK